jgi:hypothetical protein
VTPLTQTVTQPVAQPTADPVPPAKLFSERIRKPGWWVLSALICTFYLWTATSSNKPFQPRDTSREFYNQLTDSLIEGHLYLDAVPSPQLLALRDPYDPAANERFRLHDASLYRGRYYLYFGVSPALTLYVPWRLLTGKALSDDVAVTLFCMGGYVFSCLLLFLLLNVSQTRVSWILQGVASLALGLGQVAPIVLRRPRVYEVAVSAAYCFLFAGLYFLARRIARPNSARWGLVLSAALVGLAAGSRPHCVLVAILLAILYALYLFRIASLRGRAWWVEFAPFFVPFVVAALLLGWYNYARFENPLEFGIRYQVGVINFHQAHAPLPLRVRQVFASLYYLLLCLPNVRTRFPFLELSGAAQPMGNPDLFPDGYFQEPVAGVFAIVPLCLAGFVLPLLLWKARLFAGNVRAILSGLVACGFVMFAALCSIPSASGRFGLDFAPSLLVAGLFLCLFLTARQSRPSMGIAVATLTSAACLWAAGANMALSVNSYGYPLERPDSAPFRSLATRFGAGPDALMRDLDSLHLESAVTFPQARPDTRETILATGIYEAWDLLLVQYVAGNKAMLAYVHYAVSDSWSPWIPIVPGTPQRLVVDYSRSAKSLVVQLDGKAVLDSPATFYPTARDQVTIGNIRVGRFGLRDFSGKLDVMPNGLRVVPRP